jgi:hypothetical protein
VEDSPELRALEERHVVVLDAAGGILMAHPFARHREGARVAEGERVWWGNCAWDALGIVAALDLSDAEIVAQDVKLPVRGGESADHAVFHVEVPAARWWEDIGYT